MGKTDYLVTLLDRAESLVEDLDEAKIQRSLESGPGASRCLRDIDAAHDEAIALADRLEAILDFARRGLYD